MQRPGWKHRRFSCLVLAAGTHAFEMLQRLLHSKKDLRPLNRSTVCFVAASAGLAQHLTSFNGESQANKVPALAWLYQRRAVKDIHTFHV